VNSRVRATHADVFKPDIDVRACKYIWLGTHQKFDDAFTFIFEQTEHGWIWAHAYQFDGDTATFIVECSEETWRRAGFRQMSTEETIAACEKIFARNLGGHKLMSNARHLRGSAWLNFNRVLCERWSHKNMSCSETPRRRRISRSAQVRTRAGKRHCARRLFAQRADHDARFSPL
jgi:anthraniloyl-CoA monooxygenase